MASPQLDEYSIAITHFVNNYTFTTIFKSISYLFFKCEWISVVPRYNMPSLFLCSMMRNVVVVCHSACGTVSQAVPKVSEQQSTQDVRLWMFVTGDRQLWHWSQNFHNYCKDYPIQSWKKARTLTNFKIGWCFRSSHTWHLWGDGNVYGWPRMMLQEATKQKSSKSPAQLLDMSCSTCSKYGLKSTWGLTWINPGSRFVIRKKPGRSQVAHGCRWWCACPTKAKVTITIRQAVDEENQAPAPPLKVQIAVSTWLEFWCSGFSEHHWMTNKFYTFCKKLKRYYKIFYLYIYICIHIYIYIYTFHEKLAAALRSLSQQMPPCGKSSRLFSKGHLKIMDKWIVPREL